MCSQIEPFEIEKYKVMIERQKYYASLAREIFDKYSKIFMSFSAVVFAFLAAKNKLQISPELFHKLIVGIAILITWIAIVSILQVRFALIRWKEYRSQECKKDADQTEKPYASQFEKLYMGTIGVTIVAVWLCVWVFWSTIK